MMVKRYCATLVLAVTLCTLSAGVRGQELTWRQLPKPEVGERWVRPVEGEPCLPVWGHAEGLRVGIAPTPGPRGLLRIFAPYLGHEEGRMINFIAVEPIPAGQVHRGLSELEWSSLDNVRGKRFWSSNTPDDPAPMDSIMPAAGIVETVDGVQTLTVFIGVERFDNGAHVYLRLRFRADRPEEVAIATFTRADSVELGYCIATATMGNYARLRTLHLAAGTKSAGQLWPDYSDDDFAPHARIPLGDLLRTESGGALLVATPDEADPNQARYAPGTRSHWRYEGKLATQYWACEEPSPELVGLVNGRVVYWASRSPIPGGISFENVELAEPFRNGAEYRFGVTTMTPAELARALQVVQLPEAP